MIHDASTSLGKVPSLPFGQIRSIGLLPGANDIRSGASSWTLIGWKPEPQYSRRLPVTGSSNAIGSIYSKLSPDSSGRPMSTNGPAGESDTATASEWQGG